MMQQLIRYQFPVFRVSCDSVQKEEVVSSQEIATCIRVLESLSCFDPKLLSMGP